MKRPTLTRFIWLSIGAAILTIGLKSLAYFVTGSVGLLSDALESVVNLVAAVVAFIMLKIAEKPPDEEHEYGHTKAEYFASVLEGLFIIIAAITIAYSAIDRLLHPQVIEQTFLGLAVSVVASLINLVVAQILIKEGNKHRSITLKADGKHLMTDVWTSVGVIIGVALVALTNIQVLDPIIALAVAANIVFSGYQIVKQSAYGLMDGSLPPEEVEHIKKILNEHCVDGIQYHGLKTRESATRSFVSVHILVPGKWSVQQGHDLLEVIEKDISRHVKTTSVFTHLEPLEDPSAHDDDKL